MTAAGGQPTLEQVAAHAGVGRGTASRVINGSPQVSAKTREAVFKAIEELGYIPNQAARTLVTRRTGAIALVISESEERIFGEPFFAGVVRGISRAVGEASRQLVFALVENRDQSRRLETFLSPQHVDGVLMLSQHDDDPMPARLQARGVPTVYGGRPRGVETCSLVDVDNVGGARAAVEHLWASGRRAVATLTGPQDMTPGRDRYQGYAEALAAHGGSLEPALVEHGDFSEASGTRGMRALLERRPDLDAVFAASDLMAAGALRVLREAGRTVPDDVAVIGFDDSPLATVTDPPLTSVHQPTEEFGHEMAVMLLARMQAGAPSEHTELILPTSLVRRASA